ncbi:toll/interleukin-1 receptor domain-containing protein [Dyadobacter fermentans]|uniref:toll/interleukin-1 receptor domain-containing protein n=1 Tax=Dyadobacter fermentans TaxID=94254 RepID=UPI001CBCE8C5|nr:toll/interleukin-1 receptor domain-containing protein [Dyadobacter fermentans]MBZ1363030.1 toll/interleukin-1 receptor domain-containing protein [Dyadobacter fermentans]
MENKLVFISHITTEAEIARELKELIERQFLNTIEVFASSHEQSIEFGMDWFAAIKQSIQNAKVLIVLCSPISVTRTWIPFEAGAGWGRDIRVIPLCHSGLKPSQLPTPLASLQGGMLNNQNDIQKTFQTIAKAFNCSAPSIGDTKLFEIVRRFEKTTKMSALIKDIHFIESVLRPNLERLSSCILSSYYDMNDLQMRLTVATFATERIQLNWKPRWIFNTAFVGKRIDNSLVFEATNEAIDEVLDNVKFLLNYRQIEIPKSLVDQFEKIFQFDESANIWYPSLKYLVSYGEESIALAIHLLESSGEISDQNMLVYQHIESYHQNILAFQDWIARIYEEMSNILA